MVYVVGGRIVVGADTMATHPFSVPVHPHYATVFRKGSYSSSSLTTSKVAEHEPAKLVQVCAGTNKVESTSDVSQ